MLMLAMMLSSDAHVFEPRAPRIKRIDGGDHVLVEADQLLSGIGLISKAGARFEDPRRSPPWGSLKTCSAGTTPSSSSRTWRSMGSV
jgi:hypothetical protein